MTNLKWIKTAVRIGIWLWVAFWISKIFFGDLGASPALRLNHELGDIVLVLLTANLLVGMGLDALRPVPKWIRFFVSERRFWGVSAFFVLLLHIGFYFLNEGFEGKAFVQVVTKSYLIFGLICALILLVMAATSNDASVRKLGGKRWKQIHRSVYAVQVLLCLHVLAIEKADIMKYGIWLGGLLALQIARWIVHWRRVKAKA